MGVLHVSVVTAQGANHQQWAVDWFHPLLYVRTLGEKEQATLHPEVRAASEEAGELQFPHEGTSTHGGDASSSGSHASSIVRRSIFRPGMLNPALRGPVRGERHQQLARARAPSRRAGASDGARCRGGGSGAGRGSGGSRVLRRKHRHCSGQSPLSRCLSPGSCSADVVGSGPRNNSLVVTPRPPPARHLFQYRYLRFVKAVIVHSLCIRHSFRPSVLAIKRSPKSK